MSGRIESGSLQQGDNLLVLPANEYATVRGGSLLVCRLKALHYITGLMINEDTVPWAVAGDHIVITLQGIDITKMKYVCITM